MKRQALLAGLAGGALTGCGIARRVVGLAERSQACVDAAVPPANGVHVMRAQLVSPNVRGPVRYALVIPDGPRAPDAVAYVLPGRGSSADAAIGLGLDGFLAAYLRGGGRPFALA
ncbi:MAG TPA: hypothetical protein VHT05_12455, partial [Candidatus Elarobacter sp.]|nr:hypothetical protein [Candidatus Elarobacter sp.]